MHLHLHYTSVREPALRTLDPDTRLMLGPYPETGTLVELGLTRFTTASRPAISNKWGLHDLTPLILEETC